VSTWQMKAPCLSTVVMGAVRCVTTTPTVEEPLAVSSKRIVSKVLLPESAKIILVPVWAKQRVLTGSPHHW